jgi:hypothetical protein
MSAALKKIFLNSLYMLFLISINSCGQQMTVNESALKLLLIEDKEYFNVKPETLTKLESDLLDIDFYGIVLGAPKIINTEKKDELPLLIGIRYSGDRDWEYPLKDNCLIVATNLSDGSVYTEKLFQDKGEKIALGNAGKGDKPDGLAQAAALVTCVDIRDILGISLTKSEWSFSILYHDWKSNRCDILLEGTKADETIPADYIYPPVINGNALPDYYQNPLSPKMPDNGLQLTCTYDESEQRQSLICAGSYNICARNYHVLFNKQGITEIGNNTIAIVPVTLILIPGKDNQAIQINWHLPVYEEREISSIKKLFGYFTIDVFKADKNFTLLDGTNLLFICIDGNIYGPQQIKVD